MNENQHDEILEPDEPAYRSAGEVIELTTGVAIAAATVKQAFFPGKPSEPQAPSEPPAEPQKED